jgi:hypothetical protein
MEITIAWNKGKAVRRRVEECPQMTALYCPKGCRNKVKQNRPRCVRNRRRGQLSSGNTCDIRIGQSIPMNSRHGTRSCKRDLKKRLKGSHTPKALGVKRNVGGHTNSLTDTFTNPSHSSEGLTVQWFEGGLAIRAPPSLWNCSDGSAKAFCRHDALEQLR